jgi:hypothetical protein
MYEIAEKSPPEQQSINTSEDWKERKNQTRWIITVVTLAGVEVTDITNQPAFNRSNKLSSNDTSYVNPRASRTVVNSLQHPVNSWLPLDSELCMDANWSWFSMTKKQFQFFHDMLYCFTLFFKEKPGKRKDEIVQWVSEMDKYSQLKGKFY